MEVRWSPAADRDRSVIFDHIAADNPWAAIDMDALFDKAAQTLHEHPRMGAPGKVARTREWVIHASYRLVYQVDETPQATIVRVLALVHTARQWPPKR
ncbi:MAG: type II toxin-antitoxin system RelE/ParE family toxin [Pseudomonadota bacterium]|nr:type II toxin-antitoxin system RelE/ParE family toxin [Pseudomonadota bacterium]